MRALAHEGVSSWVSASGLVEFAINSAVSDASGVSPFHCVYGREVRAPVDCLDGMHSNDTAQLTVEARSRLLEGIRERLLRA